MKLPELSEQHSSIHQKIEIFLDTLDEDITFDEREQTLQQFLDELVKSESDLHSKINSWCWALSKQKHEIDYYKEQEARFREKAKVLTNRNNNMKKYLLFIIKKLGGKLKLPDFSITVRKPVQKVEIDYSYKEELLVSYGKEVPIESMVNKAAIKADLKEGLNLPFATLVDGEESLVIK